MDVYYHPLAWKTIEEWENSPNKQVLAKAVIEGVAELRRAKEEGIRHPKEKLLYNNQTLRVNCLRDSSLRIFFRVIQGNIWVLDTFEKRRADLRPCDRNRLSGRIRWATEASQGQ